MPTSFAPARYSQSCPSFYLIARAQTLSSILLVGRLCCNKLSMHIATGNNAIYDQCHPLSRRFTCSGKWGQPLCITSKTDTCVPLDSCRDPATA